MSSKQYLYFLLSLTLLLGSLNSLAQDQKILVGSYNFDANSSDGSLTGLVVYDDKVFHDSGRSLKYIRTDANSYELIVQRFKISPNINYTASCWIKTTNMSANAKAIIAIETFDARGGYISGGYSEMGVTGNKDWTKLDLPNYKIPNNATSASMILYLSKGSTGTVWFDDLSIFYVKTRALDDCNLISPAYAGLVYENKVKDIEVRVQLANYPGQGVDNIKLKFDLINSQKTVVASNTQNDGSALRTGFLNSMDMTKGSYFIKVSALDNATQLVLDTLSFPLKKVNGIGEMPLSFLSNKGVLIREEKPFFPIGMYFSTLTNTDIDEFSNSDFNTIIPYNSVDITDATMTYLNNKGLKVLYSVKDYFYGLPEYVNCPDFVTSIASETVEVAKKVNQFKNSPALLGWYINDELPAQDFSDRILKHYNVIKANDINHPTYAVDYRLEQIPLQKSLTDVFGTDYYPIRGFTDDNYAQPGKATKIAKEKLVNRPVWTVVQVSNLDNYSFDSRGPSRAPNLTELRNMSWQSICEGSTGLFFYAWFEIKNDKRGASFSSLWNNSKIVASEIKNLVPILISTDPIPSVSPSTTDIWLNYTVKSYQNKTYIFSVNNTNVDGKTATFFVPNAKSVKDLNTGIVSNVSNEQVIIPNYGVLGVKLLEISNQEVTVTSNEMEIPDNSLFSIYPNPNKGDVNIVFDLLNKADYYLEVSNLLGQVVYEEFLPNFSGNLTKKINFSIGKLSGLYLFTLKNQERAITKKMVLNTH